ncbi:effector-associated domain 2-containing protein [Actinoplanes utahensis]|uniref:Uncharacterized protein n=1 Tax=Actinoplanes utahensis TaxID=1869 RepID=A0A0A6WWG4_ACTUT|nr:hypothetical protein [Actinoplanes utahensis]KHD72032.1 hypothetical protein MB27_42780 [Actinoplanes utahensis]GIF31606.1 hypothetical protein Aut01nite_45920 [Actinoplanes utahensis]
MPSDPVRHAWVAGSQLPLVTAMEGIEALAEMPTRTMLLSLVEEELRAEEPALTLAVARNPICRLDLVALIRQCLQVRGGVRAMREAARLLFGESGPARALLDECDRALALEPGLLGAAERTELLTLLDGISLTGGADVPALFVEATRPLPAPATVSTMIGAVRQLERRGTAVPLLRFLQLLANHSNQRRGVQALRTWIDHRLTLVPRHRRVEVTALRDAPAPPAAGADVRTCLLVRLEPVEDGTFTVMAWLGQTGTPFGPNCGPEDVVTLEELRQWLGEFIGRYAHGALDPGRRPLIEFALPSRHLNLPVDTWTLTGGDRLGALYQVTVRPLDRPAAAGPELSDRWKSLVAGAGAELPAQESVRWLPSTEIVETDGPDSPAWAWIAVTCPLMHREPAAVDAVLATGTPVAAWLRGDKAEAACRAVLEGLSRGRLVTQFPDSVRAFRHAGWQDGSDHRDVVLLWDDPTRPPPPSYPVSAPQPRS